VGIVNMGFHNRMKGVTVRVNEDICVGCEECLEVCKFRSIEIKDNIASINQNRCMGCGRCEQACPNNAISITIDDNSRVNELIAKLESYVDVAPQGTKIVSK
jgi:heterodisulfide reductase subunit A-like polyferredoxin